jgi:lipoyl synthase
MSLSDIFDPKPKKAILPQNPDTTAKGRFPSWLHRPLFKGENLFDTNRILEKHQLNTVCEEAKCPNRLECYSKKTATFLALGKQCTRNCGFCDIDFSKNPKLPEESEPLRIALSVQQLGLSHVVITMVARDDLPDQGSLHIAQIIQMIREKNPSVTIEVLTSDFSGDLEALHIVLNQKPEVFNHNIETVRSLTPRVRHKATYDTTLKILSEASKQKKSSFVKSGLMVGLGEKKEEVQQTLQDLYQAGVEIVTIGQYLQPNKKKLRVKDFISPDLFKEYEEYGKKIGIPHLYCGPFVRSSYNAALLIKNHLHARK